nr:MAG TPA: hypothetical protein [Siphoviridae sp. ctixZ6]
MDRQTKKDVLTHNRSVQRNCPNKITTASQ